MKNQVISLSHATRDRWQVDVDEKEKDDVSIQYITPEHPGEAPHWLVWISTSEACRLPGLIGSALAMLEQHKTERWRLAE